MVNEKNFPYAYKEVYTILGYMDESDVDCIPKEFIKKLEENMDKSYNFQFNPDESYETQTILHETNVIFMYIFMHFWADDRQKGIIREKFRRDMIKEEEEKIKNYKGNELFKKKY